MAKRSVSEKKGQKSPTLVGAAKTEARVRKLERENRKLRNILDDIWGVLNEINPTDPAESMFEVIDHVCNYFIADLPTKYRYSEQQKETKTDEERAANILKASQHRYRREMAEELGVTEDQAETIRDPNVVIPALRKIVAKEYGLTEIEVPPQKVITEEEYKGMVNQYFMLTVIFSARIPCHLRSEVEKFIRAANELKALLPKRRNREPALEVQKALEMRSRNIAWHSIYSKIILNWKTLPRAKQVEEARRLRDRVKALTRIRRSRGQDPHSPIILPQTK
jgi:hypothetical protein